MTSDHDAARRAFDRHDAWDDKQNAILVESGSQVVRSLLLLNGAAVVAMLAFLSTTITAKLPDQYLPLVNSMIALLPMFGYGAFLAVVAAGFAYFTNYIYMWAHRTVEYYDHAPFVREKQPWNRILSWIGHVTTILAIASGISSGIVFMRTVAHLADIATAAAQF